MVNRGAGRAVLRLRAAYFCWRPGIGVKRREEVPQGGRQKSKDHAPPVYKGWVSTWGFHTYTQVSIIFFPNERCYAGLCTPVPSPTYPDTSPSPIPSEFTPLSTKRSVLTASTRQPGVVMEQCFLEWVSENTAWKTDFWTQPARQPIGAFVKVLCGTGERLGVSLEYVARENPLKHRYHFPWKETDTLWGCCFFFFFWKKETTLFGKANWNLTCMQKINL